jgi:protein-S-isoprenylcysteine O-methyltransferase Ste14
MINQTTIAILLSIPALVITLISISYWSEFIKEKKRESGEKIKYKKIFLLLVAYGFFFMWISWITGIIFLFLNKFYTFYDYLMFSFPYETTIQVIGLVIFYTGASMCVLTIIYTGKNLRPSISGLSKNHKLITSGPFRIVRHPLYVSYVLILVGLSLTFFIYWILIPAFCVIIGIYPTAKAEEERLTEQFEEEYIKYKQKVGMFFPKLF